MYVYMTCILCVRHRSYCGTKTTECLICERRYVTS